MDKPDLRTELSEILINKREQLPPTPPHTEEDSFDSCSEEEEDFEVPLPPPSTAPIEALDIDKKTPDAHVPRDSRLIRLTGIHPFNVEAPLTALFNEGFLTTPELHFVRNHGAVPEVRDEDIPDWNFSVEGMVEKPFTLSLRQLMSEYKQITVPVTLVCAGNRRKEQNAVKKSKGFSWGPAGVSTSLFTGVTMSDVISRARPRKKARFVCMEGADALPNGSYGTSVKLNWVKDPNRGIMLAYKMNGEMLRPDHGKPLRAVVPGQIGGRSVKWLKRLIVTADPSDNWYHINDNRVLPTTVSPEESATNKDWWTDERYAIHDLNPNSAIACPAHQEKVQLHDGPEKYRAQGYAYSGGGRRVTRVELSLDKGKNWQLASIEYPEDRYREVNHRLFGGRLDMSWRESCFCWCFWSLDIPVESLANANDMVVRCMDESMCIQPKEMYWSVLGMMNNPWFRVTITEKDGQLLFEHPTQPALMPGGWMERVKKEGGDLTNGRWGERIEGEAETKPKEQEETKEILMTKDGLKHEITIEELRAHGNETDPWFVVNGEVYDGTPFLKEHPGGATSITAAAGQDASDEFMAIHSQTAKAMMSTYHLGTLSPSALRTLNSPPPPTTPSAPSPTFLNPKTWLSTPLTRKRRISPDTYIFTFRLSHPTQTLGLPTGQHVLLRHHFPRTNSTVIRAYTPISPPDQRGSVDILIKLYLPSNAGGVGGKMSQAISALLPDTTIELKGPIGKFTYHGRGHFSLNSSPPQTVNRFIMLAAGSGITPILQVFRAVMSDEEDRTRCTVVYGNREEGDILCREELEGLVERSGGEGGSGEVKFLLSGKAEGWGGGRGRVDKGCVREVCGRREKGGEGVLVLVCGPEGMERGVRESLKELGWGEGDVVFF